MKIKMKIVGNVSKKKRKQFKNLIKISLSSKLVKDVVKFKLKNATLHFSGKD